MRHSSKSFATAAALAFGLTAGIMAAHAQNACDSEIEKTRSEWQAIGLQPGSKPTAPARGRKGHEHVTSAVDSMRFHMAEATTLCRAGKDHEALLHLDVVRAFLKLPEIQHPTDHRYLYPKKKA